MAAKASGRLAGKRALVTGASSGIGEAVARRFAAEGARVALVARRADVLQGLAKELGSGAIALQADVAEPDQVAKAVRSAVQQLGGLDIVVNAAGVDGPASLRDMTPDVWRRVIDINLSGTFYVAREAALHMLEAGSGTIINVGSELSFMGMGLYVHYCASKAGVIGLTKALAVELAPTVTVNAICPGPVDTPMMEAEIAWFPDPAAARQGSIDRVPMKRWASPEEVATAIVFLAADAPYATGTLLSLDGGTTAL